MSGKKTDIAEDRCQIRTKDYFGKDFTTRLRHEYLLLSATMRGIDDPAARSRYASLLLYRLMFLYFLQSRGLLAGDQSYLQHHLARIREQAADGESFYTSFLRPLFAGGGQAELAMLPLASLFIAQQGEASHPALTLPDSTFAHIFALFEHYHWPSGSQPDVDSAVLTPEMPDTLLEQAISQKEMGVYYTPADVATYIVRNTLLPALFTRSQQHTESGSSHAQLWEQARQQPERYIFPGLRLGSEQALPPEIEAGLRDITRRQHWQRVAPATHARPDETWREVIARRTELANITARLQHTQPGDHQRLITWNLDQQQLALDILQSSQQPAFLETFYQTLRSLAILDPTCGTGAFLFAALPLLETLYRACLERMQAWQARPDAIGPYAQLFQAHLAEAGPPADWRYTIRHWIIEHNLYGVDLMEEAVEICRLRLFLHLLAMRPEPSTSPLPGQMAWHICAGNSLTADLDGSPPEAPLTPAGSAQTFCWSSRFPEVMQRGGFDVVIGNPPYVDSKQVNYAIDGYLTMKSGNLYALTMERSLRLLAPGGNFGMIVPASATCTDGYSSLQRLLLEQQELHIASFSDQCGRLFALPHPRLCIILYTRSAPSQRTPGKVFTTAYLKPGRGSRKTLFECLSYTEVTRHIQPGIIPRHSHPLEAAIQQRLAGQARKLSHYLRSGGEHTVYCTRKLSWFVQITPFIPLILDEQGKKCIPSELKALSFSSQAQARIAFVALNSNLFYWLLSIGSDCRNLNMREVRNFPLDLESLKPELQQRLDALAIRLEQDLQANARLRPMTFKKRGTLLIQCMYPACSKALIDEIDLALAEHYGFTAEEVDFLLSYDAKYRRPRRKALARKEPDA